MDFEGKTCCDRVQSDWGVCFRPAKGLNSEGKPVCGIHLAAERKRDEVNAAERARREAEKAFRNEVEAVLGGMNVRWKGCSFQNRTVTLDWDELQSVLASQR